MKLAKLEPQEAAECANTSNCLESEEDDRIIPFMNDYLRTFSVM